MSVGLVSTVVLALAAGLLTSVKSSQAAKETQEVDAALSAYAESFKDPAWYPSADPCTTPPDWSAVPIPDGAASASVTKVDHWDSAAVPNPAWADSCTSDPGVHRLTVEVEMSGSSATATAQVVMRKP